MNPEGISRKSARRDGIVVLVFAALCALVYFADFAPPSSRPEGEKVKAEVVEVDNSGIQKLGLLLHGPQNLKVKILEGGHKGEVFEASNQLRAQMDLDKVFEVGDTALVGVWQGAQAGQDTVNAQDFYRINRTLLLFGIFAVLLVAFGGFVGLKALLSFVFACLVIWKVLVPFSLKGYNAVALSLVIVCVLSAAIIFLVAGLNRKGLVAFIGAMLGVVSSCVLAMIFSALLHVNGATMPYSQALYYSGYDFLGLSDLFVGAVFLAASGAVMDLSVDISAGMSEVSYHTPNISRVALMKSGFSIGRTVVGTMTTTLLFAYAGGYLTLLMTFSAQGVGPADFINSPYVAAEIVRTLVGSIGIVLVAPFTAVIGAFMLRGAARKA